MSVQYTQIATSRAPGGDKKIFRLNKIFLAAKIIDTFLCLRGEKCRACKTSWFMRMHFFLAASYQNTQIWAKKASFGSSQENKKSHAFEFDHMMSSSGKTRLSINIYILGCWMLNTFKLSITITIYDLIKGFMEFHPSFF